MLALERPRKPQSVLGAAAAAGAAATGTAGTANAGAPATGAATPPVGTPGTWACTDGVEPRAPTRSPAAHVLRNDIY